MSTSATEDSARAPGEPYEEGDLVGDKYRLLRKAGEGAMGVVWVARNMALASNVAIKLLRPEMHSPLLIERFLREARAAAQLTHPAVVRVFDLGETVHAEPYIVMELLEGEPLRDLLRRERCLSPEKALAMLLPIAGAMQAAHERGIVHRDLKPDNIMLVPCDGSLMQPKVVDFGVAKLSAGMAGGKATGAVLVGTPQYMSPEQASGLEQIDHRTDIWALCTVLYELLVGATPFSGKSLPGTLRAILQAPAPSLVERSAIDPALWAIIERGLSKAPDDRWASMRELGEALAAWLSSRGVEADVCGASLGVQWLGRHVEPPAPSSPRTLSSSRWAPPSSRRTPPSSPRLVQSRPAAVQSSPRLVQGSPAAVQRIPELAARAGVFSESAPQLQRASAMASDRAPGPDVVGYLDSAGATPWRARRFPFMGLAVAGVALLAGAMIWMVLSSAMGMAANVRSDMQAKSASRSSSLAVAPGESVQAQRGTLVLARATGVALPHPADARQPTPAKPPIGSPVQTAYKTALRSAPPTAARAVNRVDTDPPPVTEAKPPEAGAPAPSRSSAAPAAIAVDAHDTYDEAPELVPPG